MGVAASASSCLGMLMRTPVDSVMALRFFPFAPMTCARRLDGIMTVSETTLASATVSSRRAALTSFSLAALRTNVVVAVLRVELASTFTLLCLACRRAMAWLSLLGSVGVGIVKTSCAVARTSEGLAFQPVGVARADLGPLMGSEGEAPELSLAPHCPLGAPAPPPSEGKAD